MEYIEVTKEEIEKAKECCETLNCEGCPLKESDYCIEQIKNEQRRKVGEMDMLTIKEINNNWDNTECNSCGKARRKYYEIRYGIPVSGQPWQPYSTLPICRSCMRKLYASIERKLSTANRR